MVSVAVGRRDRSRVRSRAEVRAGHQLAVAPQLDRRPAEADRAVLEHICAVRHVESGFDELLDEQNRDALVTKDANDLEELSHHSRREALRHLVDHHQTRLRKDRPSQCHHLLLAAGQRADELMASLTQPGEQLECGRDVDLAAGRVGHEPQRVLHRQVRKQAAALGDVNQAQLGDALRRAPGHVFAREFDMEGTAGPRRSNASTERVIA